MRATILASLLLLPFPALQAAEPQRPQPGPAGTVTAFAFDGGESLSEHSAPYDALVQVLEGEAGITIAGKRQVVPAGEVILLPANVPHAVDAPGRFKMLLTMIRA